MKEVKLAIVTEELIIDMNLLDGQLEFLYGLREGECAQKCYDDDEKDHLDGLIEMCERFRDVAGE